MTPALLALGLRDYQGGAIDNVATRFFDTVNPIWRQLGVLPTGTGKTVIAAALIHHERFREWMETFPETHRKVLMIAHTEEIVDQSKNEMLEYNPTLKVEIERAEHYADVDSDIVCASVQTLSARKGRRLTRFDLDQYRIIIMDEAHHSIATTWRSVGQAFGFLPPEDFMPKVVKMDLKQSLAFQRGRMEAWDKEHGCPDALLLGITATPKRTDRVGLEAVYQDIVFNEPLVKMVREGFLSRPRAVRVFSKTNIDSVSTKKGDLNEMELAEVIDNKERNRLIVKAWLEHGEGRRTFAFCASVDHARDVAECFNEEGIKAALICGETKDRSAILERLALGGPDDEKVLTAYGVLTEGVNVRSVSCILHARPTKSELLYTQMTGRGSRLSPETGKEDFIVIDVVDVTKKHSLMTAPSLVGLPMDFDADGKDLIDIVDKIEKMKEDKPFLDVTAARSLDELDIISKAIDILPMNDPMRETYGTMSWHKKNDGLYDLAYSGIVSNESLQIQETAAGTFDINMREFKMSRPIVKDVATLPEAFAQAEAWLVTNRSKSVTKVLRNAAWRKSPITESQKDFIDRMWGGKLDSSKLTRGQASELIDFKFAQQEEAHAAGRKIV